MNLYSISNWNVHSQKPIMPSTKSIFKDVKSLSDNEIEELFNHISELISFKSLTKSIHSDSREQRYSNGVVCLHCGSTSVINMVKRMMFNDLDVKIVARHLMI